MAVGSADGKVYELDAATGVPRWAVDLKAPIAGGVTIAGSTIYVGTDPGVLHALSVANGAETLEQGDRRRGGHGAGASAPR